MSHRSGDIASKYGGAQGFPTPKLFKDGEGVAEYKCGAGKGLLINHVKLLDTAADRGFNAELDDAAAVKKLSRRARP